MLYPFVALFFLSRQILSLLLPKGSFIVFPPLPLSPSFTAFSQRGFVCAFCSTRMCSACASYRRTCHMAMGLRLFCIRSCQCCVPLPPSRKPTPQPRSCPSASFDVTNSSTPASCSWDEGNSNVNASFHIGLVGSSARIALVLRFFVRLSFTNRYSYTEHVVKRPNSLRSLLWAMKLSKKRTLTLTNGSWEMDRFFAFITTTVSRSAWGR